MIEKAVGVYEACRERMIIPSSLDEGRRADYAFIDSELMKESLERYGQLRRETALRPASLLLHEEPNGRR